MSKVLIVDDHASFRKGLNLMLCEIPEIQEIREVADGIQFLSILNEFSPDLVFLDIRLPGIGGIEAANEALKSYPDLRIVMMTIFDEEKYLKDAMDAGAKGFFQKPPTLFQLREACKTVLQNRTFFKVSISKLTK